MEHLFENSPNPTRLLIITADKFADAIMPLVHHKNRTGMPTHFIKLSQIVGMLPDVSEHPWAIKNVIAHGHKYHGTYYVMLVGDASHFPVKHRFVKQADGGQAEGLDGTYNPTDNYYANLYWRGTNIVSDWDANNDGKFNEQTWGLSPHDVNPDNISCYPDVAVGRIPAHNANDVANYIQKVIDYEIGNRMKSVNSFSFLSDNKLPGSQTSCEGIINQSKIEQIPNAQVNRYIGNLPISSILPNGWNHLKSNKDEIQNFTSKWLIHVGHGTTSEWEIKLDGDATINNNFVKRDTTDTIWVLLVIVCHFSGNQLYQKIMLSENFQQPNNKI